MTRNSMKSYIKFLSRNKLYTAIEAVGLIVSLALVIVVGSSLRDQLKIANDVPGGRNLFILGPQSMPYMEYRDKEALTSLPEVEAVAAFIPSQLSVKAGPEFTKMPVLIADTQLLSLLGLEVTEGSLQSLQGGRGVALSQSAARRLFPFSEALGQIIGIGTEGYGPYGEIEKEEAEVVAIIADSDYSILDSFDVFCPMESNLTEPRQIRESDIRQKGSGTIVHAIASLTDGADIPAFSQKFISLMGPALDRKEGEDIMATAYRDLYFSPTDISGIRQGNRLYLYGLVVLGLVLLLSAVLNYMNLCSAISGGRAKEMATRRLLGEDRKEIFTRIMLESILFTAVCYILAIILARAIVPYLNSIRPGGIPVEFRVLDGPAFWLFSIAAILLVGAVAGLLPASMLSSFQPIEVVSGKIRRRMKMGFNKACVITQSVLAIVLVCMSIALRSQLRHLETLDIGISPRENLFYFHPSWYYSSDVHLLGDKLASLPDVKNISYVDGIPTHIRSIAPGPSESIIQIIRCDTSAFHLLGFREKEAFTGVKPGTFWPEEALVNFGDLHEVYPDVVIGGILEPVRRLPVNAEDLYSRYAEHLFTAVSVASDVNLTGLLIETGADHKAFRKDFTRIVTEHYGETIGVPDLGNSYESQCGYLEEIIAADYVDLHRYTSIVTLFGLVAVFLAMLGLVAMSTWFASRNARDIAVRKVFGSETREETLRTLRSYMVLALVSMAIGIPVASVLVRRFLEGYADRITGYWWIFALAALLVLLISFASVLWQTLKAARTNPATELKKE